MNTEILDMLKRIEQRLAAIEKHLTGKDVTATPAYARPLQPPTYIYQGSCTCGTSAVCPVHGPKPSFIVTIQEQV